MFYKLIQFIKNPLLIVDRFFIKLSRCISSDKFYLKVIYFCRFHRRLNLEYPKAFTEKIQWLKLHNTSEIYTQMADKYGVRELVKNAIGEEYLIPLLGVWNSFDEIDFSKLPNQFVLKTTHDSGGIVICHDKNKFDIVAARKKLETSLKHNYFYIGREYPYKNIYPRIIAEKLMVDESGTDLKDYKFFCIDGKPHFLFIASERFSEKGACFNFYDMNLDPLPFKSKGHRISDKKPCIPNFDEMKLLAEKLCVKKCFPPQLRVDLYNINGKIYFGEYTFHHDGGLVPFEPDEWDFKLGELVNLPIENRLLK